MKKSLVTLLALAACTLAVAGGNSNNSDNVTNNYDQRNYGGNTTNQGGQGGTGGVGYGGSASAGAIAGAAAGASADVKNTNTNVSSNTNSVRSENTNLQGQGQQQGQGQNQSSSATGGNATGQGSGNTTTIKLGDVHYQEAAQAASAYAPQIPTVALSCRLYFSFGAAGSSPSTTASASGGIPIPFDGNDQVCLSTNAVKLMAAVNAADKLAGRKDTFSVDDFRLQICKIEGMNETEGCKAKPAAAKRAEAAPAAVVAKGEPTDPYVRARLNLPPLK